MYRDKIRNVKTKVGNFCTKVGVVATAMAFAVSNNVYAAGLEDTLKSTLTVVSDKAIAALATMMAIAAMIAGAMSIYDMAQGSKSSNPEQQDKGQKTLVAAVGMAVGAAALLGIKTAINTLITSAMNG